MFAEGSLAHQNAWDFETLRAQLGRAGFDPERITESMFQGSQFEEFAFEGTYPAEANQHDRSLYVELLK